MEWVMDEQGENWVEKAMWLGFVVAAAVGAVGPWAHGWWDVSRWGYAFLEANSTP